VPDFRPKCTGIILSAYKQFPLSEYKSFIAFKNEGSKTIKTKFFIPGGNNVKFTLYAFDANNFMKPAFVDSWRTVVRVNALGKNIPVFTGMSRFEKELPNSLIERLKIGGFSKDTIVFYKLESV